MLKADVRTAQEMFEELGYKKNEDFSDDKPTYENEYLSLTITKGGVVIFNKIETMASINLCSLTIKEIEAIYKQIKELK